MNEWMEYKLGEVIDYKYKKDGQLITDLKFIRPYFVDLALDSAVKMIDEEIKRAVKELPFAERKKYKNDNE